MSDGAAYAVMAVLMLVMVAILVALFLRFGWPPVVAGVVGVAAALVNR